MGQWSYIASRLNGDGTETFLDFDVPLKDTSIEDVLSGPNNLSGVISPEYARLKDQDGQPVFNEWSTAIYAELDGNIRGGGILAHSGFSDGSWELECVGFIGYWKDMPYVGAGQSFIKKDPMDIVRHIGEHVQSIQGSNLALQFSPETSPIRIGTELTSGEYDPVGGSGGLTLQTQDYKLAWYQDHDLLSNINGLSEETPFDYHETHEWVGENMVHHLNLGYPTLGSRRDELRFVVGENIFTVPDLEREGDDYASEVYALGAGEGAKMIRGHATLPTNRLRRAAVVIDSSRRRVGQADSLARSELARRQMLDSVGEIVVREHKHAAIGAVNIGDEIFVEGSVGWVDMDAWYRVLGRTLSPESPGVMKLTIARTDRIA
jgi:hypothetical protein